MAGHNIATRSENQFWVLISHCCLGHPPQSSAAYPRELGSTFYNLHHTKDELPSIVSCRFCAIYLHLRQSIKTLQWSKPKLSQIISSLTETCCILKKFQEKNFQFLI